MQNFYEGKSIFLTGSTGFLGKSILYKILTSLPTIKKVYLLIRKKKGSSLIERLKKEIYESSIFNNHRNPSFEQYFFAKVYPIQGDLLSHSLITTAEDESRILNNVEIFINCAASVDFNAAIADAIQTNVMGSLRMYELYSKLTNPLVFLHVSTAYVNSDMLGFIEEKVYQKNIEPIPLLNDLIAQQQTTNLHGFPNTYTFTKYLAERILLERQKGIFHTGERREKVKGKLVIVRPSIIGSSYRDPIQGWVDNVSAAGALFLLGGMGIVNYVRGNPNNIGDLIPVDYVTNYILVAIFKGDEQVFHCSSSERNPVTWGFCSKVVVSYWRSYPSQRQFATSSFHIYENKHLLKASKLKEKIPQIVYENFAKVVNNQDMIKKAMRWKKVLERGHKVGETFEHFTMNEYIFGTEGYQILQDYLNEQDRKEFFLDIENVDWFSYLSHFAWGLKKFVLKEKEDPPSHYEMKKGAGTHFYFSDIQWTFNHGKRIRSIYRNQLKKRILESKSVSALLTSNQIKRLANERCDIMFGDYYFRMVQFSAWLVHKFFKQLFDKIVVDKQRIQQLNHIDKRGTLILAPNHTSYIDILIIAYIFYSQNLTGVFFNTNEEIGQIFLLGTLFRMCGGFFIDTKKISTQLQEAIVTEYMKILIEQNSNLELFAEASRTRNGKLQQSKNKMIEILAKSQIQGLYQNNNITIVPVNISYDKVVESEQFAHSLLGENRQKASIKSLIQSIPILKESFGKIYVDFLEEINLKDFCRDVLKNDINNSKLLGQHILKSIRGSKVIVPTAVIASIILMYRTVGISEEDLFKYCAHIGKQLQQREKVVGGLYVDQFSPQPYKCLQLLQNLITKKQDMFQVSIQLGSDSKILLLSYYKNGLLNTLFDESITALSLVSFGMQIAEQEGVELERLLEEIQFLKQLLRREVLDFENTEDTIRKMIDNQILIMNEKKLIKIKDIFFVQYLCSLIWPLIDAYYVTIGFLYKVQANKYTKQQLIQQIQWFADALYYEKVLEHYECCSKDTLNNSLKTYKDLGLIQKQQNHYILIQKTEQLNEIDQQLNKFVKQTYAKSIQGIMKNTPLIAFPLNSKL